jgi:hypothetical protein
MNPVASRAMPWHPVFILLIAAIAPAASSYAQAPAGYTPDGDLQQIAMLRNAGIVAARLEASRAQQIRVTVQVLSVDDQTRASIYEELGVDAIKTRGTKISTARDKEANDTIVSRIDSVRMIGTTSHVSTSVLDQDRLASVMTKVKQSAESAVLRTPSIILLDGLSAGYSDISQRPFVVDVERLEGGLSPVVQVLEEGTRIQVTARLAQWDGVAAPRIQLHSEISWHKIVGFETEYVFGIEKSATPIQVPTYVVKTAIAAEELAESQVLMVDPYLSELAPVQDEPSESVLKRLSYVGRSFKAAPPAPKKRHLIFLLQPSLQKSGL